MKTTMTKAPGMLNLQAVRDGTGKLIGHTWRVPSGGFRGKRIGGYAQPFKQLDRSDAERWVHLSHWDATQAARTSEAA
jgi:hypothetical protein